ncbi:MAG: hypothetical protein LBG59_08440 [Candidatus Peribacteria bacterium]|jgi:hypothetical protein|nr:hypothetical protein [Candidatus Peribacteria bacterium]
MENNREKNLDQTAQKKAQRILEDTQHIMKKQVCLKDLLYRKEDNDEIFDKIICQIINTGLKENKIMFLNPPT